METLQYPLYYHTLSQGDYIGFLLGTSVQMVAPTLDDLLREVSDFLQWKYRKQNDYPNEIMSSPSIKEITLVTRLSFSVGDMFFPFGDSVKLSVPVVYGADVEGEGHVAYLPYFKRWFRYYDGRQLDTLAKHFANLNLDIMEPHEVLNVMCYSNPGLKMVRLRVNPSRPAKWNFNEFQRSFKVLDKVANLVAAKQSVKKRTQLFPDTAMRRDKEVNELIDKLLYQESSVIVVGNRGVGKSTVIKTAFNKIRKLQRKNRHPKISFWQSMPERIFSNSKYFGQWQRDCELMVEELEYDNGVLWMENFMELIISGNESPESGMGAFLLPYLVNGKLHLVGELNVKQYDLILQKYPEFANAFQLVEIKDFDAEAIKDISRSLTNYSQQHLKVEIQSEALLTLLHLQDRYLNYENFPGRTVKFLSKIIQEAQSSGPTFIKSHDIIEKFSIETGLPQVFLRDDIALDINKVHRFFESKIIGQPQVVDKLVDIVKLFKTGLNNPKKPIQTLVFAGSTGVGKTASAKALADFFYGQSEENASLIRIDMSEYQHPNQILQLIGYDHKPGFLINEVRNNPFSVLLLDEVEKAHKTIFDAFMGILDEGFITDAYGRVTNFKNTIIILSTNLGASTRKAISFGDTLPGENEFLSAIEGHFRPEFINRIDDIIFFNRLDQNDIRKIAIKELDDIQKRPGIFNKNIRLKYSEGFIDYLAEKGYHQEFGARQLQRTIEELLIRPLSIWLLDQNDINNCELHISLKKDRSLKIQIK